MNILEKIGDMQSQDNLIIESGVRDMTKIAKEYKKAYIYFHKDLDGIASALGIKKYLEDNGIKVVGAEPIQYGSEEYSVKQIEKGVLPVLVDFAHGKPMMRIHLDHHDNQVGFDKLKQSVSFSHTPSNIEYISQTISPTDVFTPRDIEVISTVDTADFSKFGLEPDDIMRAVYKTDKDLDVSKNHQLMGLVVNKLALSYKNKKGFLSKLVMNSNPSLMSMYNVIKKLAKSEGYKSPEDIETGGKVYTQQRQDKKLEKGKPSDIPSMGNGESFINGTTVFQKGGGYMGGKNVYDRYTIFGLYPESDYLITQWPMGMVQVSANPFAQKKNPYHLGDIVMKKIMPKFKSELQKENISIDRLKYEFERDIGKKKIKDAVGFNWSDFEALYKDKVKGLQSKNEWWPNMVKDITNKPYKFLSKKQKDILKKVTVNAWDIIMASSGGHKSITNLSGLNFLKDTKGMMNKISMAISKEMQDKKLK